MMNPATIKRGDNLVYHNRVLKVVKIKKSKKLDELCVVAKPHFITKTGLATSFSIPFSSMEEGNIRKIISKTAATKLLRSLQYDTLYVDEDSINVSDIDYANLSTEEMISLLQLFSDERKKDPKKFATSKKLMMNRLTRSLSHIVGAALGITLKQAEDKIENRLEKREE